MGHDISVPLFLLKSLLKSNLLHLYLLAVVTCCKGIQVEVSLSGCLTLQSLKKQSKHIGSIQFKAELIFILFWECIVQMSVYESASLCVKRVLPYFCFPQWIFNSVLK